MWVGGRVERGGGGAATGAAPSSACRRRWPRRPAGAGTRWPGPGPPGATAVPVRHERRWLPTCHSVRAGGPLTSSPPPRAFRQNHLAGLPALPRTVGNCGCCCAVPLEVLARSRNPHRLCRASPTSLWSREGKAGKWNVHGGCTVLVIHSVHYPWGLVALHLMDSLFFSLQKERVAVRELKDPGVKGGPAGRL